MKTAELLHIKVGAGSFLLEVYFQLKLDEEVYYQPKSAEGMFFRLKLEERSFCSVKIKGMES